MHPQAPSQCQRVGEGLAAAAARRRLSPPQAIVSMQRALPELLSAHPELVTPLMALLSHPLCTRMIASPDELTRRQCAHALLDALNTPAGTPQQLAQRAFVEGLLSGLTAAAAAPVPGLSSAEPDWRERGRWLSRLAWCTLLLAAVGFGAAAWRLLHRHVGDQPLTMPPVTPSQPGRPPSMPPLQQRADGVDVAAVPGPACSRLAALAEERQAPAASSNYARRLNRDAQGRPIPSSPALIVLHETVIDLPTTIGLFQSSHDNDAVQASYHVLIGRDGQRVRVVADVDRAYGAGDSAFEGYTVRMSAANPPSINNIALHVSLESPPDGRGDQPRHSGYTQGQYQALAAQVLRWQALYGIPNGRITTHASVDRSHTRKDPRSFDWDAFWSSHAQLRRACA